MKAIILAGGSGTRLYPLTKGVSKQLIAVYDKPMIYYPLSVLMLANIKEILIITTPEDSEAFQRLLGDGKGWGLSLSYAVQPSPDGLAQAFHIGEEFLDGKSAALILGDNLYYGAGLEMQVNRARKIAEDDNEAVIFGYQVSEPEHYGVAELGEGGKVLSVEEKPKNPKSHYAITGLYFYPGDVCEKARNIKPSARGELEITTLNDMYLQEERLKMRLMGRGYAWLDTGTHDSMLEAAQFIQTIEKRQGLKVACPEEIAWEKGWISTEELKQAGQLMAKNEYGRYLLKRAEEGK